MREDRGRFLDALDLRGRTVLDLGSNLGEISREARARGAALVDGFEIDPYFNEIAQLVNVLTGTTGVSFYERDMADPATYGEPYDVVLAFSAFRFIADRLDRACRHHRRAGRRDPRAEGELRRALSRAAHRSTSPRSGCWVSPTPSGCGPAECARWACSRATRRR